MKRTLLLFAMLAGLACSVTGWAQFEEIDTTERQFVLGAQFYNEEYNGSATLIIPEHIRQFEGFVAGHLNKVSDEWLVVARVEGGVEVGADWTINLFSEYRKDQIAGVGNSLQIGIFAETPDFQFGVAHLTGGIGNYLEGEQVEKDLGLKATDERVVRALTYLKLSYSNYDFLVQATPNVDASDLQILIQPSAKLSDNLTLLAQWEFDSNPIIVAQEWRVSGGIQASFNF